MLVKPILLLRKLRKAKRRNRISSLCFVFFKEVMDVDEVDKEKKGIDNEDTDVSERVVERREKPTGAQVEVQEIPSDSEMDLDVGHLQKKQ